MIVTLEHWLFAIALVLPSLATVGLFVRLGKIIKTIESLESDANALSVAVQNLGAVTIELKSWRDANGHQQSDLLERVRRLEDSHFNRENP